MACTGSKKHTDLIKKAIESLDKEVWVYIDYERNIRNYDNERVVDLFVKNKDNNVLIIECGYFNERKNKLRDYMLMVDNLIEVRWMGYDGKVKSWFRKDLNDLIKITVERLSKIMVIAVE